VVGPLPLSYSWPTGNQALLVGDHLHLSWHCAYIDQQTIDFSHPHKRVLVNEALQHPGRVHAVRVEYIRDDPRLGAGRALADAKRGADLSHRHVRLAIAAVAPLNFLLFAAEEARSAIRQAVPG